MASPLCVILSPKNLNSGPYPLESVGFLPSVGFVICCFFFFRLGLFSHLLFSIDVGLWAIGLLYSFFFFFCLKVEQIIFFYFFI